MNTIKIIILIASIILIAFVGLWKLNSDFLLLWNVNTIHVTTEAPLSKSKVKIEYGFNSINRKSDKDLFIDGQLKTILYDGGIKDQLINKYGENDFLITYDNKYYYSYRHFKFNRRHQHKYNLHFSTRNDEIILKLVIEGRDNINFEKKMIKIEQADKYLCNIPIDSSKTIYHK